MASKLQSALQTLVTVFHTYSGREGDKFKLSKAEMKNLLQGELGGLICTSRDPTAVDSIMQELDENKDGEVDFKEYAALIAALTVACNQFFQGQQ